MKAKVHLSDGWKNAFQVSEDDKMHQNLLRLSTVPMLLLFAAPIIAQQSHVSINTFHLANIQLSPGNRTGPVTITGVGLNLTGFYNLIYGPRACEPCERNGPPPYISRIIDLTEVFVLRGIIDGVYFDEVYIHGQFEILADYYFIWIPMSWAKEVSFIVPVTLTGPISAYRTREDRDFFRNPLFIVNNVNLRGAATVNLYSYLSESLPHRQIFEDKLLSYDFTQPLQLSKSEEY